MDTLHIRRADREDHREGGSIVNFNDHLRELIQAGFAGIWIETWEPDEATREIIRLCESQEWGALGWDVDRGEFRTGAAKSNPLDALDLIQANGKPKALCLVNFHQFLKNPVVAQRLANRVIAGKSDQCFYVVLGPVVDIPTEIQKLFVVVEHDLPTRAVLDNIARDLLEGQEPHGPAVDAAGGLTRYEAENAFALSLARHNSIQPSVVWELKAQILRKSGLLTLQQGKENFSQLGGLEQLKGFCKQALASTRSGRPQARGVMLLGIPGTGKSAFAKALGNEVSRPTLTLDIGALYGSLVGETEARVRQALRVADAMSPCILFIDEIEKALAGVGGQGDSGVSTRLFGTFLTWLNDHTSDVFVVATSNDVSLLPPEFTRAERWDGVFFLDLPTREEKDGIWRMYRKMFDTADPGVGGEPFGQWIKPDDEGWTGAEIKACCRLAALLDIPFAEAATYVVPVSSTAPEKIAALREWASGRALSASTPGIYQSKPVVRSRRKVTQEQSA
jgi:hypothetical protein